jgi:NitT/TauT family transport system permease protein
MAITTSPRQRGGIARPSAWEAAPSAPGFDGGRRRPVPRSLRTARRIAWNLLPPLTFLALIGLWWAAVQVFRIPAYLLPGPGAVFTRLMTDAGLLWTHSQVTLIEILLGFGLTVVT